MTSIATLTRILTFCVVLLSLPPSHASEPTIFIPKSSSFSVVQDNTDKSITSFHGSIQLTGVAVAFWATTNIDNETISTLKLVFHPDIEEAGRLPLVLYDGERYSKLIQLDISYLSESLRESIGKIFDATTTNGIMSERTGYYRRGVITINSYETGVECDHRYHYANIVTFNPLLPEERLDGSHSLLKNHRSNNQCGH